MFKLFHLELIHIPNHIKKRLTISVLLGLMWFAAEAGFVYLIQSFLISLGLLDRESSNLPSWLYSGIEMSLILLVIYGVIRGVIFSFKTYYAAAAQQEFVSFYRKNIVGVSLRSLEKYTSSEVISLFNDKVQQASQLVLCVSLILGNSISAILFLIFGFYLAPKEFSIALAFSLIFILPIKFLSKKVRSFGANNSQMYSEISQILLRCLNNYFFIKIYNLNASEISKINNKIDKYQSVYFEYLIFATFKKSFPIVAGLIIISCVTYFSYFHFNTQPSNLLSFFYIFLRFAQSISDLAGYYSEYNLHTNVFKEIINWTKINRFTQIPLNEMTSKSKYEFADIEVSLDNVSYGYTENIKVIDSLNLNIKKNSILVIKGPSGSGKSTLIHLILGLFNPSSGSISINGIEISKCHHEFLALVGYVGPDPYIIPGTVKENLFYGINDVNLLSEDQIWQVLAFAEIESFIRSLPFGIETVISQIPQISTGQKQRISIARALLRNPKLLILDEATANLDSKTELSIIDRLSIVKNKCTLIIITHKDSFDTIADNILRFEDKSN